MKKTNMMFAASLAATVAFAPFAAAQNYSRPDAFLLEAMGQRGWTVSCQLTQADGDRVTTRDRGRGLHDNARVQVSDVQSGTCSYEVPERGALRLTMRVDHTQFECPFTVTEEGFCRAQLRAGTSGSFRVERRAGDVAGTGS